MPTRIGLLSPENSLSVMIDSTEMQVATLAFLEPDIGRPCGEASLQLAMPPGQISKAEGVGRQENCQSVFREVL
ncbi:hypothetical protein SKAU_G00188300 [Synaphobranchus kaupii]|uniref:Uncharacterized protein n=1 Tax=Synaphobranchus kaupii TaxID=118154 RepID=A0A9Q1IWM3_SYNKA|nr:hypothetical protein SKAU_G00188300 [Synaphobranchus kaupii]